MGFVVIIYINHGIGPLQTVEELSIVLGNLGDREAEHYSTGNHKAY